MVGARRGGVPRRAILHIRSWPGRRRGAPPAGRERAPAGRAGAANKGRRVLRQPAERAFQFVADHRGDGPISWACDAREVPESGYHAWAPRPDRSTEEWRQELGGAIAEVRAAVSGRYGSSRMTAEWKAPGHECSEHTVAELMREHGIRAKAPRRFARTTDSGHRRPVAADVLDRDFEPQGPGGKWCADITCIPTPEGWVHLAAVEDVFSRMIVGRSMAESMDGRLVVDARDMAPARRRPGAGLLARADRGSRYAREHDPRVLSAEGVTCGMSGVGPCWGHAPVESFFGRLKCEREAARLFATRDPARAERFEYREVFDNRARLHSPLGLVPPAEYERAHNLTRRELRLHFSWGRSVLGPRPAAQSPFLTAPAPAAKSDGRGTLSVLDRALGLVLLPPLVLAVMVFFAGLHVLPAYGGYFETPAPPK